MAHSTLVRANIAGLHYVHTLAAAYQRFLWITDPDYAHQNDQEAWAKVRRDAGIYHAIARRRSAAGGSAWNLAPASRAPEDVRAAEAMTDLLMQIERFDQSRQIQAEAIFRGSAWAYICGRRRMLQVAKDAPRTWWVPERLQHVDRWRFRISRDPEDMRAPAASIHTRWEMFNLSERAWKPLDHAEWFVRTTWEDLEESMGYGRGLLHAIYFYWRAKEIVWTHGLAALERWAQGLIQVGIDGARQGSETRTNDAIVDEWITQLSKTRTEHVIVGDKNDEIRVHQGGGEGHQMVIGMLEYIDRALDRLILSSTLPTGGGASDRGSYGRAAIEQEQAEATFISDRHSLSEDYQRDLMGLVWRLNRIPLAQLLAADGLATAPRMPTFELIWPRQEDPKDAITVVVQALSAGIPLKAEEVYERIGYTRPDANDEVLKGPSGGGPPGMGGGFAAYAAGQPCKPGETAERSKCLPAKDDEKVATPRRAPIDQPRKRLEIGDDFARRDVVDALDEPTRKAIDRYTSDEPGFGGVPPYADLNDQMRAGRALSKNDALFAASLDRFIAAHGTFETPLTVYRGIGQMSSDERDKLLGDLARAKTRDEPLTLTGFQSTSLDPEVAEGFARGSRIVFEITTDRGALVNGLSPMSDEKEVLLGHGWKYQVEEIGTTRQLVGKYWRDEPLTIVRMRAVR